MEYELRQLYCLPQIRTFKRRLVQAPKLRQRNQISHNIIYKQEIHYTALNKLGSYSYCEFGGSLLNEGIRVVNLVFSESSLLKGDV